MKDYDYEGEIFAGEIWKKTRCLEQEDRYNDLLFNFVESKGFVQTEHFRVWKKGDQTIIICLVDDILSCSTDYHSDLPYLYDKNTTVITDNYLTCPSVFKVVKMPLSFFGIYSYTPECSEWLPERDFSFQVNRIDQRRFNLMIDLAWRTYINSGYVNFNCEDRTNSNLTPQQAFEQCWNHMSTDGQIKYRKSFETILPLVPCKNYDLHFDKVPLKSWINIVVETYSSDNVIALSEKIFRALVTPAPWTVYSGRYTVAYLESLGFDCMSDLINHNHYDRLKEVENKLQIFNWKSLEIVKELKNIGIDTVRTRCNRASQHNQARLRELNQQTENDIIQWIDRLPNQLEF